MTLPAEKYLFRTAAQALATLVLFGVVASFSSLTCSSDSGTGTTSGFDSLTWNLAMHMHGDSNNIITVTKVWGPEGTTIDAILPGKYVVNGTYNLEGSPYVTGVISLNFDGMIRTIEEGHIADNHTFTIPEGSISGTYTVIREFFKLVSGSGNPMVEFSVDNVVRDRVTLY